LRMAKRKGKALIDPAVLEAAREEVMLLPKFQKAANVAAAVVAVDHFKQTGLAQRFTGAPIPRNGDMLLGNYDFATRKSSLGRGRRYQVAFEKTGKFKARLRGRRLKMKDKTSPDFRASFSISGAAINRLGTKRMHGIEYITRGTKLISYEYQRRGKTVKVTRRQYGAIVDKRMSSKSYAKEWEYRNPELEAMRRTFVLNRRLMLESVSSVAFKKNGQLKKAYQRILAKNRGAVE
jgi:hypothetical protein